MKKNPTKPNNKKKPKPPYKQAKQTPNLTTKDLQKPGATFTHARVLNKCRIIIIEWFELEGALKTT